MKRTLVIGYGNPLRGDDGVGWCVTQRLREQLPDEERLTILTCHQLTPELAEQLSQAERVFFVDASMSADQEVVWCTRIMGNMAEVGMTHQASPAALLAATEILYGTQPEAYLFSVRGERFEMNEPFSGQVEASIPAAVALLIEQLKKE